MSIENASSEGTVSENIKKLAGMLGLCARSGKLIYGSEQICEALASVKPSKKPTLIIMASDVSENTGKRICDRCKFYGVRLGKPALTQKELAHCTGRGNLMSAVALTDINQTKAVTGMLPVSESDK